MTTKTKIISFQLLLIFLAVTCIALAQTKGKAEYQLERMSTDSFSHIQRPASVFSHDDHNAEAELEEDCSICHHVYEGKELLEEESSEDTPCSDCHSLKPTPENSIALRTAFHTRCKSCHFEQAKGPVLCGECHIRRGRIK